MNSDELSLAQMVDEVCTRFEDAWQADDRPRIEDYLADLDGAVKREALRELIELDVHYRQRLDESCVPADYQALPDVHIAWLEKLLRGGAEVLGNYKLLKKVGRGSQGVVYVARHVKLNQTVALKMIRAGRFASEADVKGFETEAQAAAGLAHQNIVPIYYFGEHEGCHYFTMRLMEGGSLREQIEMGPVPPRRAAQWLLEVTRAIVAAHDNRIVHRDLKPGNVVLDRNGVAHVTDFGLARQLPPDATETQDRALVGTVCYMAPEQTHGMASVASDIYGLGAILYALLTGRPPFKSDTVWDTIEHVRDQEPVAPRLLNPKADADLERVCLKCLRKDPKHRYARAAELAEDLEAYIEGKVLPNNPRRTWLSAMFRPVEYVLQVEPLKHFGRSNVMSAVVGLLGHTAVFAILCTGQPIELAWLALALIWTLMAINIWLFLLRQPRSAHPVEGYVVGTYVGYLFAFPILFLVGGMSSSAELLAVYPYVATLTGLVAFIHGSLFWGPLYLVALGYYVLALVMRLSPEWAPLEFGVCHGAYVIMMSRQFRTRGPRSTERT